MDYVTFSRNPAGVTLPEVERDIVKCSGFVKTMMGVANNCAYLIMMNCLDQLRRHPKYDKRIKRLFEGKDNSVLAFYKRYRNRLRLPLIGDIAFFAVADMPEGTRKKYGSITDAQYFEFWESSGSLAYEKSLPWVSSLWNKFRLSLQAHGVLHPKIAAWGLVGASVLELAVETWDRSMRSVQEAVPVLPISAIQKIYRTFSLQDVSNAWQKAFMAICPESNSYHLDPTEEKNIIMGINQLRELWISPDLPFDATIAAVKDYADEIFRTKGEVKKSIRQLSQMRADAINDLNENR